MTLNEIIMIAILFLAAFGVLFLFFPAVIIKLNQLGNIILFKDEDIARYSGVIGTIYVIVGVILIFEVYYFK